MCQTCNVETVLFVRPALCGKVFVLKRERFTKNSFKLTSALYDLARVKLTRLRKVTKGRNTLAFVDAT